MTFPRRDPYVWIHLAGLATVPLWLDLCLSGLAVGDPVVPPWVELMTLGLVGTVPILWMQLQRPFYIFSIPGLAVRPDKLGEDRRRLLTLQHTWLSRTLVCLGAIALFLALYWLYQLAPTAADMTPFADKSRSMGWLICAGSFLLANLFVQVPATVLPLVLASPQTLKKTPPHESAAILQRFMVVGLRLPGILPDLTDADGEQPVSATIDEKSDASAPISAAPAEFAANAGTSANVEIAQAASQTPGAKEDPQSGANAHIESVPADPLTAATAIAEVATANHPHVTAEEVITDTVESLYEIVVEVEDTAPDASSSASGDNNGATSENSAIATASLSIQENHMSQITEPNEAH